jgi:cytochrome b involved in lipid metabolism
MQKIKYSFSFDVTEYLTYHPGGYDILVRYGGIDATNKFNGAHHSEYAIQEKN